MARSILTPPRLAGVATCVPAARFDNVRDTTAFPTGDVRKVVAMAGVNCRHVVDERTRSSDLCFTAAETLLDAIDWPRESIDGLVLVTQTPDYFMPSSSCLVQARLGLSSDCAAFDVNLGCSGYVYGLWLTSLMLGAGGLKRVLLLNGETPTLYAHDADRAVSLLFGDAGSATALEADPQGVSDRWVFALHSDGSGAEDLIIRGGGFRDRFSADRRAHYVEMNGANVFNFTLRVVPPLIEETLDAAGLRTDDVDYFIFHQSNRFIINHLIAKCGLPPDRTPVILSEFGNAGGPSVPLTITRGVPAADPPRSLKLMLIGYGVGLSWAAVILDLPADAPLRHVLHPVQTAVLQ